MDTKFQALPPLKRHRLLQQQQQQENKENVPIALQLPAKKRKESRNPLLADAAPQVTTTAAYCLPTKKRVWALHPDLVSGKPLSPFNLNVEYIPSFNEEIKTNDENKKIPLAIVTDKSIESEQEGLKKEKQATVLDENNQECKEEEEKEEEEDDGILCAICRSTDGDPIDPIVFCDGCDLMVHTTCYGNPLIKGVPDGEWFCIQCLASKSDRSESKQSSLSCCLCPTKGGALKPTATKGGEGSWAHVVCALLIPEVFFEDPDGREGIHCSKVPKRRWEGKCYVCKRRKGCVIDCSEPKCPLAFHATCGLKEDLCIEFKEGKKKKETIVAGFCKSHTELWDKQQQSGKFKIVAREEHRK
ncbi:PHD FINGER PROTEINS [Salix koriyanagi]|uniref:PHD FINGER PROTEINS n=1 Tax=Salix koriyanagi TaxID=2511006 RepID=A0A9Q0WYZ9_9ROSI|nr:PHD FINGER PROTEINS [Salix koriyanagi]